MCVRVCSGHNTPSHNTPTLLREHDLRNVWYGILIGFVRVTQVAIDLNQNRQQIT